MPIETSREWSAGSRDPQLAKQLASEFARVRAQSEQICEPLAIDDYQLQSIPQTSPPKWHLAHVTWFFEAFVLPRFLPDYRPYHAGFAYLFNSYYYTQGEMHPRPRRGLLSRPTVAEILAYRASIDQQMLALMEATEGPRRAQLESLVTLGLNHEQQHQELLLMDIKHNFSINPLQPAYRDDLPPPRGVSHPVHWLEREGGIHTIGWEGLGFCFDNETPSHQVLLHDHRLADRLVTNGEYLEFMADGGYREPALWLSDGWALINREHWHCPLYWGPGEVPDRQFTLGGPRDLDLHEPVCHLSYYEADAYARWAGKRLPREEELELVLAAQPLAGNFLENDLLHPAPAGVDGQWYGDLWAWTESPYSAYPGFTPLAGSMGEYNGKFMSNQMVLKGGCCATPAGHLRASYRNFFYPDERWAFTGLRLAEDG